MDILEKAKVKLESQNRPIKKQALKPPKPPTKKLVRDQEEFFIDFNKIANNSSFQRFIVETIKTCVPQLKNISARTSKEVMNKAFSTRINEIDNAVNIFDEITEIGRGTHQAFREVVSELKEKLAKRKAKIDQD